MESLWQIHIRITARWIRATMLKYGKLFDLPSTCNMRKSFSVRMGDQQPPLLILGPLHISKNN